MSQEEVGRQVSSEDSSELSSQPVVSNSSRYSRNAGRLAYRKGYRVSPDGELIGPRGNSRGFELSKPYGYPTFQVKEKQEDGRQKTISVRIHWLVAYQKYKGKWMDSDLVVRHMNGDKTDFRPRNIRLGTASENEMDKPISTRLRVARQAAEASKKAAETGYKVDLSGFNGHPFDIGPAAGGRLLGLVQ